MVARKSLFGILHTLLLLLLSLSCEGPGVLVEDEVSFSTTSLFSLPTNGATLENLPYPNVLSQISQIEGQDYLILTKRKSNLIQRVNLSSGEVFNLAIPEEGPHKVDGMLKSYWINNDSVIVMGFNKLKIFNAEGGEILSRIYTPLGIDIPKIPNQKIRVAGSLPSYYLNGSLYFLLQHDYYDNFTFPEAYEGSVFGVYSLKTNELQPASVYYPEEHNEYFGFLSNAFLDLAEQDIYVGYGFTPNVYCYNLADKTVALLSLPPIPDFPSATSYRGADGSGVDLAVHSSSQVAYGQLFRDEKNDLIYRVVKTPGEKPGSFFFQLLIYNENNHLVFHEKLPPSYYPPGAFLYQGKLHIPDLDYANEQTLQYRLVYPTKAERSE